MRIGVGVTGIMAAMLFAPGAACGGSDATDAQDTAHTRDSDECDPATFVDRCGPCCPPHENGCGGYNYYCDRGTRHIVEAHCDPCGWGRDADAEAAADTDDGEASEADALPESDGEEETLPEAVDVLDDDAGEVDASTDADADERYTSWTDCGWTDGMSTGSCLCDGLAGCDAVAGGVWEPLGSHEIRVCAQRAGSCDVAFFREVEGGGTGFRCTIATSGTCGFDEARDCEAVFTCNLLMGDCPPGVVPTNVIPCDLVFGP